MVLMVSPFIPETRVPSYVPRAGEPMRVGWLVEPGFGAVDREVAAAIAAAADLLKQSGCEVEAVTIPAFEQDNYVDTAIVLYGAELGPYVRGFVGERLEELHFIGKYYATAPPPALADYLAAERQVDDLKAAFAAYFQRYDLLLCPVVPFTAPPPGLEGYTVNGEQVPATHMMRATAPFNLTGLPSLSVPFSFSSEGLPINVQLISRWFDEATILRLGQIIESATGAHQWHPMA